MRVSLLAAWFVGAASFAGCEQEILLCDRIPDGGCPLGRGGTCEDPYCDALYDCVEGAWTLVETCAEGGAGGGSGGEGGQGGEGQGGCNAPVFDHTDEVEGCEPDLQPPDCPVQAAEICGDPCLTECVDFYMCTRPGWSLVAFCDDGGQLVIEPGARP